MELGNITLTLSVVALFSANSWIAASQGGLNTKKEPSTAWHLNGGAFALQAILISVVMIPGLIENFDTVVGLQMIFTF